MVQFFPTPLLLYKSAPVFCCTDFVYDLRDTLFSICALCLTTKSHPVWIIYKGWILTKQFKLDFYKILESVRTLRSIFESLK